MSIKKTFTGDTVRQENFGSVFLLQATNIPCLHRKPLCQWWIIGIQSKAQPQIWPGTWKGPTTGLSQNLLFTYHCIFSPTWTHIGCWTKKCKNVCNRSFFELEKKRQALCCHFFLKREYMLKKTFLNPDLRMTFSWWILVFFFIYLNH